MFSPELTIQFFYWMTVVACSLVVIDAVEKLLDRADIHVEKDISVPLIGFSAVTTVSFLILILLDGSSSPVYRNIIPGFLISLLLVLWLYSRFS